MRHVSVWTLTLAMAALGGASAQSAAIGQPGTTLRNVAEFRSDAGAVSSNPVTQTLRAVCGVAASAPAATAQTGAWQVLDFEVVNLGTGPFDVSLAFELPGAEIQLPDSVRLEAGERRVVPVQVRLSSETEQRGVLTVSCAPASSTRLLPARAQAEVGLLPQASALTTELLVESTLSEDPFVDGSPLDPAAEADGQPAGLVRYQVALQSVSGGLVDAWLELPPGVRWLAATAPATLEGARPQVVGAEVGPEGASSVHVQLKLAPGERGLVWLTAQLPDVDDARLLARVSAQPAQSSGLIRSQPATVRIWAPLLALQKLAGDQLVTVGSRVQYEVTATNASRQAVLSEVELTDTLPLGLAFVDGTARLDGQPVSDLDPDPQRLKVLAPVLVPGAQTKLTYDVVVTPQAAPGAPLVNVVVGEGRVPGRPTTGIQVSRAAIRVQQEGWGDLVGRVYLDRDGNGRYGPGDQPAPGVRVLLSGGATALTDALGRYHFPKLLPGRYGVSLDPQTLTALPQATPGDLGVRGAQLVQVSGLVDASFPLRPSSLQLGVARVSQVRAELGGARATLRSALELGADPLAATLHLSLEAAGQGQLRAAVRLPRGTQVLAGLPEGAELRPDGVLLLRLPLAAGHWTVQLRLGAPATAAEPELQLQEIR